MFLSAYLWDPDDLFMPDKINTWSDSRQYCREADLIIINTEDKQVSLCECLLMNERNHTCSCFYSHTSMHIFIHHGESVDWFI